MSDTAVKVEVIRRPLLSGHCASHVGKGALRSQEQASHQRCVENGGGQRANPAREFQPCPCPHHYIVDGQAPEVYECSGCGGDIIEAGYWPADENGDVRYTHVDRTGRALGEECQTKVSRNEPEPEPTPEPVYYEPVIEDDFSDLGDEEEDDDLSDFA